MGDVINIIFFLLVLFFGVLAFFSGGIVLFRALFGLRRSINDSLNMVLEVVRVVVVPRDKENSRGGDSVAWREEIAGMEQFLASLAKIRKKQSLFGAYPNFRVVLEIANPADSEEISFYMSFHRRYKDTVEKQLHSFYPDASVEVVPDYTIFFPKSETKVSLLKLKNTHALPLRTYEELDIDPLNEISNALSKLHTEEEGAALQVVLEQTRTSWRSKGKEIAHNMQQGKQLDQSYTRGMVAKVLKGIASVAGDIISSMLKKSDESSLNKDDKHVQLTPEEQELIKAIETKTKKQAFKVNVRLLASAQTSERAEEILSQLENAFGQFERADVNYFNTKRNVTERKFVFDYVMRNFNELNASILGVEEIASIFHFPVSTTQTPKIKWLKSGAAPPPVNIPREGGIALGYSDYRGVKTDIRLSEKDRRRHLYAIGQTGTGKSVFLTEMAKQDIKNGHGMCYIDPHGDAVEELLTSIPRSRAEDVILFDPADVERPLGLNMLEYSKPEEKTFVINEMISIFDKLYDLKSTGGPMFEQYMRNAMLLIMEDPESGSTLMEISKVLADEDFRKFKLRKCNNPIVRDFWTKEAEKAGGEAALANMVPYITSKLTQFISNDIMRPIIAQQNSTLNFREIMDTQKILLINLSKGKIGETNSHLLGMVIVGKLLMAALGRVDMQEDDRRDFYLYIDEFQNVTTDSISQILSEARKYRLGLIIAHQFIGQLSDEISKAVFGNVGSLCSFRVGPEDGDFLEKQFEPIFSARDLINVDNYNCFAKLLINNESTKPFNMKTYPPTEGDHEQVSMVKTLSRLRYGRDEKLVNKEIMERSMMA